MKRLLAVTCLLVIALTSCRSIEPVATRSGSDYYGYTLKPAPAVAPFRTAKGHSYYYRSRDARSPYRNYLRSVSNQRDFGSTYGGYGYGGPHLYAPHGFGYRGCYGTGHHGYQPHCR